MKKVGIILGLFLIVLQLSLISAIDVTIKEKEISSLAISSINKPAIFDLEITNNRPKADEFQLYSTAGVVDLKPKNTFIIEGNSTKTITLEAYPRKADGYYSFEYKIKDSDNEIHRDDLAIRIVELKDAFEVYAEDINPDSKIASVRFKNIGGHSFTDIKVDISSVFFDYSESFLLGAKEEKLFEIPINKDTADSLLAGPYIINTKVTISGSVADIGSIIRFNEHSNLETTETNEGILLIRQETIKTNKGNVPIDVEIVSKKNFFPALFTTFNIAPTNKDSIGANKYYIFEKRLGPNESLKVVEKTNWWILIIVVASIVPIVYFARKYILTKLRVIKKATFVKTRGGEFALKISIVVKARDFVERIKIVDKLPGMVKLYERYGTITPDKVDTKNRRLEWNVDSLDKGEERVFSYIIYSKMGVVGKFELPEAEALYEFKGKIKEIVSNRSFFINEPDKKKPRIQKIVDDVL